jgi:hypothetical protein
MSSTEPIITINNLQIHGSYEFEDNVCTLCRGSLIGPQLQDLQELHNNNKTLIEMKVVIGKCNHIFHRGCLQKLIKSGFLSCPTCKLVWEQQDECNSDLSC